MNTAALTNLLQLPQGLSFSQPRAFLLLLPLGLLLGWWLWRAGTPRRWLAPLLRALTLALLIGALAGPQSVIHSEGSARPVLIDASASITPAMRGYAVKLLRQELHLRARDPAMLFASTAVELDLGAAAASLTDSAGCSACGPGATDLEAALNRLAADPAAHNGPITLVTDGWENRGSADSAVNALRAAGIQLEIFTPPGGQAFANVAMTALSLPPALSKAEPFALGVSLSNFNAVPATGALTLYRNGQLLDQRSVTVAPGASRFDFPVNPETAGLAGYRAVFKPADPALDQYPEDDSLQGWVGVGAQRKVLILTGSARDANYLDTVVRRFGLQPTIAVLGGNAAWNGSPKGYDAVILNDVARNRVTPAAQAALVAYVNAGGSLAMVGGDQSFGLGGWESSPLARVLPVLMKPPERRERTRALVLIIDKSGSMSRAQKLDYAKAAALTVTKTLHDNDLLGVIGFDSQPFVVIPLEPVSQSRPYFDQMIDRLKARGTTYLLPALQEADRILTQANASLKHVVILTDGETGGTAAMYYDLVASMHRDGGVTISTIAIGREANLALLEAISRYGGGSFYQTDSAQNLPSLFLEDVRQRGGDTTMVEKDFIPYTAKPDAILGDLAGRKLPALKGFVATSLRAGATLNAFVDSGGVRAPVIASWKFGAGKALAVTTDASGRWSSLWVQNGIFSPLWDKLVAWMTPQKAAEQLYGVALGYRAGHIELQLTDYSASGAATSGVIDAVVTAPDGTRYDAILTQAAPGEMTGRLEAAKPGTYYIELKAPRGASQTYPPLAYTVSPAVNAELPRPEPNYGLLEHLAAATGGQLNPSPHDLAITRPAFTRSASLSRYLLVAAMLSLMLEALVRRLTF